MVWLSDILGGHMYVGYPGYSDIQRYLVLRRCNGNSICVGTCLGEMEEEQRGIKNVYSCVHGMQGVGCGGGAVNTQNRHEN